ncbi:MAG: T9SS C-terminal target domain-containing protein [Ignavibacteriales bacterium]|nr:MAG: T9SS C-terminal target domain-containing protein [Ignavibacteriales bacterium]
MSTFLNESITTNGDYRVFIGSGPYDLGTGESVRVGFAYCAGVGLSGLQDAAAEALFSWNNYVIPVELTSFTVNSSNGNVFLNWSTASEINNKVFEVERSKENSGFITIGFVEGKGTTTEKQEYSFIDKNITSGKYFYRLKQIDFDGTFKYSTEIEVNATTPLSFSLEQNFPNPFNPSTKIVYSIPQKSFVTIKVFDPIGKEISQLVYEEKECGRYEVDFDAPELSSGVYFYRIEAGNFIETKKMILLR